MAVTLLGKGAVYGMASIAVGITALSGYVSPKFETLSLSHQGQFGEEEDTGGNVDMLFANERGVECQFRFKPKGSNIANAKLSLGIPTMGAGVTITGLPIVAFGGFTDVFNTNAGNTQPWFYIGNATIEGVSNGLWTATFTLRRYIGITSATAIT